MRQPTGEAGPGQDTGEGGTVGIPSALAIEALNGVAEVGWQVTVRADFDAAGLAHMRVLMAGIGGATAWRMSRADYLTLDRSQTAPVALGLRLL